LDKALLFTAKIYHRIAEWKGGFTAGKAVTKRQCPPKAGRRGEGSIENSADAPPYPRVRTQLINMRVTAKQKGCDRGESDKFSASLSF